MTTISPSEIPEILKKFSDNDEHRTLLLGSKYSNKKEHLIDFLNGQDVNHIFVQEISENEVKSPLRKDDINEMEKLGLGVVDFPQGFVGVDPIDDLLDQIIAKQEARDLGFFARLLESEGEIQDIYYLELSRALSFDFSTIEPREYPSVIKHFKNDVDNGKYDDCSVILPSTEGVPSQGGPLIQIEEEFEGNEEEDEAEELSSSTIEMLKHSGLHNAEILNFKEEIVEVFEGNEEEDEDLKQVYRIAGALPRSQVSLSFSLFKKVVKARHLSNLVEEKFRNNETIPYIETYTLIFEDANPESPLLKELLSGVPFRYSINIGDGPKLFLIDPKKLNLIFLSESKVDAFMPYVDNVLYISELSDKEINRKMINIMLNHNATIGEHYRLDVDKHAIKKLVDANLQLNKTLGYMGTTRLETMVDSLFQSKFSEIERGEVDTSIKISMSDVENILMIHHLKPSIDNKLDHKYTLLKFTIAEEQMEDILGLSHAKKKLLETVALYKTPLAELQKAGIKRPKGIIFSGKEGVGKTMLGKAFSNMMGANFFYVSTDDYIDANNKKIQKKFEELNDFCYNNPEQLVVMLMDEIDSMRKRGSSSHNNSFFDGITNQYLYSIDRMHPNIIIVGCTNHPDTLDPSLVRNGRLSLSIDFDGTFKKDEVNAFLAKSLTLSKEMIAMITHMVWYKTGADIAEVINQIKIKTVVEKNTLTKEALKMVIFKQKYNVDSFQDLEEKGNVLATAYHEAGHAICFMKLFGSKRLHEISIYPVNGALGFITFDNDTPLTSLEDALNDVIVSLAGRYAELLLTGGKENGQARTIYGKEFYNKFSAQLPLNSGASSDLDIAEKQLDRAVGKFNMFEFNMLTSDGERMSEETLQYLSRKKMELFNELTTITKTLVKDSEHQIKKLAEDLMEQKVIVDKFDDYID
jgi:ATP-dependent Zn protease